MVSPTTQTTRSNSAKRPAPAARERRRSTRIPSVTAAKVGPTPVQVFDVSLDGVGFRTDARFDTDTTHPIVIGNGPMHLEGTIRITSIRPRRDGTFDVGGVFV